MQLNDAYKKVAKEAWNELTPIQKKSWKLCRQNGLSTWQAGKRLGKHQKTIHENLQLAEKKYIACLERIKKQMEEEAETNLWGLTTTNVPLCGENDNQCNYYPNPNQCMECGYVKDNTQSGSLYPEDAEDDTVEDSMDFDEIESNNDKETE